MPCDATHGFVQQSKQTTLLFQVCVRYLTSQPITKRVVTQITYRGTHGQDHVIKNNFTQTAFYALR